MKLTDNSIITEKGLSSPIVEIVRNIQKYKIDYTELGEAITRMKISSRLQYSNLLIALLEDETIILFDNEDYKVSMIPVIPFYDDRAKRFKCAINIRQFSSTVKTVTNMGMSTRKYEIDEKRLHAVLMYGVGCIATLMSDGFTRIVAVRDVVIRYQTHLWLTIINRLGSLGSVDNASLVKYMIAKWILVSKYGMTDINKLRSTALKIAEGVDNGDLVLKVDMRYDNLDIPMSSFLKILEEEFPQLRGKLDLTYILRAANTYLNTTNILALEYPGYTIGLLMTYMDEFAMIGNNKTFMKELSRESKDSYNAIKADVLRYVYALSKAAYNKSILEEDE